MLLCAATWNPSGKLQQCNRRCIQLVVRLKTRVFPDKSATASFLIMGVDLMRRCRNTGANHDWQAHVSSASTFLCCEIRFLPAVLYVAVRFRTAYRRLCRCVIPLNRKNRGHHSFHDSLGISRLRDIRSALRSSLQHGRFSFCPGSPDLSIDCRNTFLFSDGKIYSSQ